LIATQQWHMRRAVRAFRHFGIDAVAPPVTWHAEPPAAMAIKLREGVCGCLDFLVAKGFS
jgi:uncharacterized SAM-binding protein YcdF (DUF218 family)